MPKQAFGLPAGAPEWGAFRARLKRWRTKRGISQQQMARLLGGRDAENFRWIELGRRMPQAQTILRFQALEERYRELERFPMEAPEGFKRKGRRR